MSFRSCIEQLILFFPPHELWCYQHLRVARETWEEVHHFCFPDPKITSSPFSVSFTHSLCQFYAMSASFTHQVFLASDCFYISSSFADFLFFFFKATYLFFCFTLSIHRFWLQRSRLHEAAQSYFKVEEVDQDPGGQDKAAAQVLPDRGEVSFP